MRIYYTTTARQEAIQQKPSQSIGGFKSASAVPNSTFGTLFSDVSTFTLERNLPEYIGLILVNERENTTESIKLWLNFNLSGLCLFKVAIVELNSKNQSEILVSNNSKPIFAEFYDAIDEESAIEIPNMVPGEMYGIWIERIININSDEYQKYTDPDYIQQNINLPQIEEVDIKISFIDGN